MEYSLNATLSPSLNGVPPMYTKMLWSLRVLCPLCLFIILFGLISNTINMIVFYKASVKDNVTTLLFSLAVSDTAYLCLASPNACFFVIKLFASIDRPLGYYPWPFHSHFLSVLFYWPAYTTFDLSCFISLSLGVMRCACVAMPLKFKSVFTKSRTVKWVIFLVLLAVSLRIPVLSIYRVIWKSDPVTNSTYLYVSTVNSASMNLINDIMNRAVVIWISYIVMVSCVCLLSFKLYQASKIRRSCTNHNASKSETGMSARDAQVVKSVVLVCSIFICSQLPLFFMSQIRLFDADFNNQVSQSLFGIMARLGFTASIVNASVNIFVYYNYNSKFRAVFLSLFRLAKEEKTQPHIS